MTADITIERTNRSRRERHEREQAATAAQEAAVEDARRAIEEQRESDRVRRAALSGREAT